MRPEAPATPAEHEARLGEVVPAARNAKAEGLTRSSRPARLQTRCPAHLRPAAGIYSLTGLRHRLCSARGNKTAGRVRMFLPPGVLDWWTNYPPGFHACRCLRGTVWTEPSSCAAPDRPGRSDFAVIIDPRCSANRCGSGQRSPRWAISSCHRTERAPGVDDILIEPYQRDHAHSDTAVELRIAQEAAPAANRAGGVRSLDH